jgi:hypothetical protein
MEKKMKKAMLWSTVILMCTFFNAQNSQSGPAAGSKMKTIRMEEMTAPAVNAAIAQGYMTAVAGVGSTGQHGPHFPTMTDTRIAEETVHRVALKLGTALQARTIPVGISDHHLAFGGTISLQPETLKRIPID